MLRIVCVSDTHARHADVVVPPGDVLLHAGDFTTVGERADVCDFDAWLGSLPHPAKVVIAGNHDFCFERHPESRRLITNAVYLQDESAVVAGLTVYGSPWQPWFFDWAFNLERGPALAATWAKIPAGTDILITHGPPAGILDMTSRGERVGCEDLLARVRVVRPKLHVFGHIHESAGVAMDGGTLFLNAAAYNTRRGIVIEWGDAGLRVVDGFA